MNGLGTGNDTFTINGAVSTTSGNDTFTIGSGGALNDTFTITGGISTAGGNDTFTIGGGNVGSNDTFTIGGVSNSGANDTFTMGSGLGANDTFTIGGVSATGAGANDTFTIEGGVGSNDTFTIGGTGTTGVTESGANDTFTISDMGASNDTFTIGGGVNVAGNDTFTMNGLGTGNDTFTIGGAVSTTGGNDTFTIGSGGALNDTFTITGGISTAGGNDTFTIGGGNVGSNDTFTIGGVSNSGANDTFTMGSGLGANDTFTIGGVSATGAGANDTFTIEGGVGSNDTFTIGGTGTTGVTESGANDTFTISDMGASNDTFTIGGGVTVTGNDTFTMNGLGTGNDTFTINGAVSTTSGNDTFTIGSGGALNDTFTITGGISTAGGNDTFTIGGGSVGSNDTFTIGGVSNSGANDTFTMGSGLGANDTFTIGGVSTSGAGTSDTFTIEGGVGSNDTFTIGGTGTTGVTESGANDTFTISDTGASNDTFTIGGGVASGSSAGNDTFTIGSSGVGNDTFTIDGGVTLSGSSNDTFTTAGGAGQDTFTITGGITANGSGNDTFTIAGGATGNDTFTIGNIGAGTGTGNDTFTIGSSGAGNDTFNIGNIGSVTNNDTFTIGGVGSGGSTSTGSETFNIGSTGTGNDAFNIGGVYAAGNGNDTFVITDTGSSNDTFTIPGGINAGGSTGNDTFTIGNAGTGNDTFIIGSAGSGAPGVTEGSGNDTFIITQGGGASDTFTIPGGVVATGAGNDTFVMSNGGAAAGNDTFTIDSNFTGGTGNDRFFLQDTGTGASNDQFVLNGNVQDGSGNDAFIMSNSGAGSDTFTINGSISAGDGNDTFEINDGALGGNDTFTVTGPVSYGAGSDDFILSGAGAGVGSDTFNFRRGVSGAGSDTFVVNDPGAAAGTDALTVNGNMTGGAGNDEFFIQDTGTGASNDTITVNGTMTGGSSNNVFYLTNEAAGNDSFLVNGALSASGAGGDSFEINNTGAGNVVCTITGGIHDAGGGSDTFTLSNPGNGNDNFTIDGGVGLGAGSDQFSVNALGNGNDTYTINGNVTLGNGNDTFFTIALEGAGNQSFTVNGGVSVGSGSDYFTLGAAGAGTDVFTITGPVAYGAGADSIQLNGSGTGNLTFNLTGGVSDQGYDTYTINDPGAVDGNESFTVNGNLGGGPGNNTFIVTSGLNAFAGQDTFTFNGNMTGGAGFNTFNLADGGMPNQTFTLNGSLVGGSDDANDSFQLAGAYGTIHLISGSGAGADTYQFSGSLKANVQITAPDQATRIDVLDFSTLTSAVNVNMGTTAVQTVAPALTLQLSDANGISDVIGTAFNDTIQGNARSNTLAGAQALDSNSNAGAPAVGANGKVQVVLLDFDTAYIAAGGVFDFNSYYGRAGLTPLHVYTTAERQAILQTMENDYAPFLFVPGQTSGGIYFVTSASAAQAAAQQYTGSATQYITEYFDQSVGAGGDEPNPGSPPPGVPATTQFEPGGTSSDLDFRDADMTGTASIQVNGILGEPLEPPATEQNWVTMSAKIAAHELGHLLGLHHEDSFGPIGQGIMPLPDGGNYSPAYPGPNDASETFDNIMTSGDSVGANRWNDLRPLDFDEREDIELALAFEAPTTPTPGSLLVAQQSGNTAPTSPQSVALQPMSVPNTVDYGVNAGLTFAVQAVDVAGQVGLDPTTGLAQSNYYSFTGNQNDLINIDVWSAEISRYENQGPSGYIDATVTLYYQNPTTGALTQVDYYGTPAYNDDTYQSSDSQLVDVYLPATGTYVVKVASFSYAAAGIAPPTPGQLAGITDPNELQNVEDAINGTDTGNYELFIYRFKAGVTTSGTDTFIPGTGTATIIGGSGNSDEFTHPLATNVNAFVGDTRTFTLATLTGLAGSGNYSANINWGDGSSSAGTVSSNGSMVTILGSHPYANSGTYTLSLTILEDGLNVDLTAQATISADPTSTTITSAPAITYGQNGTVAVTVTAPYVTPTDGLSLTAAGSSSATEIGTTTGYSNGLFYRTDTFSVAGLAAGSHSLSAGYTDSTDSNFQTSGATGSLSVSADLTSTTIASAPAITYGLNGTVTVTVTALFATPTDGLTLSAVGALLVVETNTTTGISNGLYYRTDTFSITGLAAGSHNLSAGYSNSAGNFQTSSATGSLNVNADSTSTTIVSAPTITYGQTGTVTVTVTAPYAAPTDGLSLTAAGSTSVTKTGTTTGTSNGQFYRTDTFSVTGLAGGSHSLSASYSDSTDSNFQGSSTTGSLTVSPAATTTTLTSSVNPAAYGQALTFTATVTSGVGTPGGTVTFSDNGTVLGTGTLNSPGVYTYTTTASQLNFGVNTITATYADTIDSNFAGSSASFKQVVVGVLVLDPSGNGALNLSGNAALTLPGNVVVDSNSASALTASGGSSITASSIRVVGGISKSGTVSFSTTPKTDVNAVADPFTGLAEPNPNAVGEQNFGAANIGGGSATLNPGIYTQINISGSAAVTFNPGVYIIEGGGFSVSGNAVASGSGVTIFNTGGNYNANYGTSNTGGSYGAINLSGNSQLVNLTAPTSGTYQNILIFQDPNDSQTLSISGNTLVGKNNATSIFYAPKATLNVSGNSELFAPLIVDDLTISGNVIAQAVPTPTAAGLTPAQVQTAYGFNQISISANGKSVPGTGSGQTIAIVDAYDDPNISSDLHTFDQAFGLPNPNFTKATPEGQPAVDAGWSQEIALDVEWAHAVAPGANILLVEAASASVQDMLQAVDYARQQLGVVAVSMSWATSEFANEAAYDGYFTTPPGHTGVTFVAAAGDSTAVAWPAVSPNVLAVGGTSLSVNSQGVYEGESAVNDGGGVSAYESEPSYQQLVQGTGKRSSPDVAYNADLHHGFAVYDSVASSGWQSVGGTSAGAPQWAGLIAIADQGRALEGLSSLDGAQTLTDLYQMAKTGGTAGFHQIGGSAYNTATGLGSPIGSQIIASLASIRTVETLQNAHSTNARTELNTLSGPNGNSVLIPAKASRLLVTTGNAFTTAPVTDTNAISAALASSGSGTPASAVPLANVAPSSVIYTATTAAAAASAELAATDAGIDLSQTESQIWVSTSGSNSQFTSAMIDRAFHSQSENTLVNGLSTINDEALTVIMEEFAPAADGVIPNAPQASADRSDDDESQALLLAGEALASYCAAAAFVLNEEWLLTNGEIAVTDWLPKKKKSKRVG